MKEVFSCPKCGSKFKGLLNIELMNKKQTIEQNNKK